MMRIASVAFLFVVLASIDAYTSSAAATCNAGARFTRQNFTRLVGCVQALDAEVTRVRKAINEMVTANRTIAVRATDPGLEDLNKGYGGLSGTYDLRPNPSFVQCPPGSFLS